MRWARRLLLAISLVVTLLGVATVVLLTIDLSRFRTNLEDYVSEATSRQFVIAGRFEPSIGKTFDLVAEDVRLTNADWGTAANILELERLVISIDTWSLFFGPIDVLDLEVEGLTLHIEQKPGTSRSSWSFGDAPVTLDNTVEPNRRFKLPLWLRQAHLQRISVTYGQGWLDVPRNITISKATLSEDERDLLKLDLSGVLGNDSIHAEGLVGPLSALLDGKGPRWELRATIGNFLISTAGTFRDLFSLQGPEIHATMQGPLAERVLGRFGLPPVARGPVDIVADLTENADGIDLRVEGAFGNLTAEVVGRAQSLREIGELRLQANIRGPNLQAIGELFDAGFLPSTEFAVDGGVVVAGDILNLQSIVVSVGDARLEMDGKLAPTTVDPDARMTLSASGPEIRDFLPPGLAVRIPSATFDIQGIAAGGIQQPVFRELTAILGGPDLTIASVTLTGSTGILPTLEGLDASISLNVADLQVMLDPWLEVAIPAVPFKLNGRIVESDGAFLLSNITYNVDDAHGKIDGTTGVLPSLAGLQVTTSLSGPDASRFAELLSDLEDSALLPASDFEMRGSFSKTADVWFVDPWRLRVGDSLMEMSGSLGDFVNPAGIDIEFTASGPDLRRFLPDRGIDVPVPYSVTGGMRFSETEIALKEVDLRVGETRAWFDGTVPASAEMTDVEFDVRIAGPNLGRIGRAFDIQNLPPDTFQFEGELKRSGDSYAIDNLIAVVGENDLSGNLVLETGPRLRLTGRLESTHLNLASLRVPSEDVAEPDEDAPTSDRLIPDTPLPLTVLDLADIDVNLHLQKLVTDLSDVGDVELNIAMQDDELHIDIVRAALSNGGTLTATLDVTRTNDVQADVRLSAVAEQFRLRPAIDGDGNPIDRPPQDLKLQLSGSGKTIRDLAASANGSLSLRLGAGDIDNDFEGYLMRDMVSQLFAAINPLSKDAKYTRVNCGFLEIDFVDGVARSRAVGLQTDKLVVASVGSVNLATEALDLSFRVKQREGVGISLAGVFNPYVKVGGTLASPTLQLDTKRGFLAGTLAVVTGGLSILAQGVWDRYLSQDNYCQAVIDAIESGEIPVWDGSATSDK